MDLRSKLRGDVSKIDRFHQSGSLKCLFPRSSKTTLEAVLLNTAGGITGGDSMTARFHAGPGSALTLTTQACERIYKAQPGQVGHVQTTLTADAGAHISWLPQETILYEQSALDRRLVATLAEDASLLMVEPLVFGRHAMNEYLRDASLKDRIEIWRSDQLIYLDQTRLEGDIFAHLNQPFTAGGAQAIASFVFVHPAAEAKLDPLRALLPAQAGASLLTNGVLVGRVLAGDSFELRRTLLPVLRLLNHDQIPRCWMI